MTELSQLAHLRNWLVHSSSQYLHEEEDGQEMGADQPRKGWETKSVVFNNSLWLYYSHF